MLRVMGSLWRFSHNRNEVTSFGFKRDTLEKGKSGNKETFNHEMTVAKTRLILRMERSRNVKKCLRGRVGRTW